MSEIKDYILHMDYCASLLGGGCNCGVDDALSELSALRARIKELEVALTEARGVIEYCNQYDHIDAPRWLQKWSHLCQK